MINIGIIGSGFIAKGFYAFSQQKPDIKIKNVLTRTEIKKRTDWPTGILTNDIKKLAATSDLILECTGDATYATDIISYITPYQIPVVTMNPEFHITTGNYFYDKLELYEAEGDQPGCLFALHQEIEDMGFTPLVYGNYKNYLKHNCTSMQAKYWSKKNGIQLDKTVAFTDGSKVEIENVLVANAVGAHFDDETKNKHSLENLILKSLKTNKKYIDFFFDKNYPSGIFIATKHQKEQDKYIKYLKYSEKYQVLIRPYHFCHLEIYKSIKNYLHNSNYKPLQNKHQTYMAASITKTPLKCGQLIKTGLGGFHLRGIHHKFNRNLVPITLANNITIKKNLPEGHILTFNDIIYIPTLAINIWKNNVR